MAGNDMLYDLCIIGAGPFGSAAARHATLIEPGLKVCVIGPKEPKNYQETLACSHGIFASHYDEGRIATLLHEDLSTAEIATRSQSRFSEIAQQTGIEFRERVGHIVIGKQNDPYIQRVQKIIACMKTQVQILDKRRLTEKYPFLSLTQGEDTFILHESSGYVSPRRLIKAQLKAARLQGCDIIDDVVDQVTELNQSDGSKQMKASTTKGHIYLARKVLLAPGGFIGFRDLLPEGKKLDIKLMKQRLAFAELTETDVRRLNNMPVISWKDELKAIHFYILPPIKYPDGKYYIKIGTRSEEELHSADEIAKYFKRDPSEKAADSELLSVLLELIRDLEVVSSRGDSCFTAHTPTGLLYCDMITPTLGVAAVANGCGVETSDEIGNMAARMIVSGRWNHDFPCEKFRAKFKVESSVPSSL
ncbi:N-methyl-L-tryptophan oxidase-like [Ptychodera flava]|uniref:N-methyl-L-tryptophan oxidase-like n=1 Tax=Ptychodera flava TaxID=63121 RepID=UPI00396A11C6